MKNCPLWPVKGPMDSRNLDRLLLYSVLACVGSLLGRSVYPMQVTPCVQSEGGVTSEHSNYVLERLTAEQFVAMECALEFVGSLPGLCALCMSLPADRQPSCYSEYNTTFMARM